MSAHSPQNSQCDLNMYGPDPGDGSVKCTCDEDAPIEPSTAPRQLPGVPSHVRFTGPAAGVALEALVDRRYDAPQPGAVTLTGRAAATHTELRSAGQELRAAQDLYRKAEARWKQALDAHMQEIQ